MPVRIRDVFAVVVGSLGLLVFLSGCSGSMETNFKDGKIYFVNNTRPWIEGAPAFIRILWVVYDETQYEIPFNKDCDGNPTNAGAVELTPSPLAGGTVAELECIYTFAGSSARTESRRTTVIIDGNMTVEAYSMGWEYPLSSVGLRVIKGIWEGF